MSRRSRRSAWPWILLFSAALAAYLIDLGSYPISDAESKYAEAPREMLSLGDWLTPHYDFIRYLGKAPLVFWITAAGYGAFGVSEFMARLPTVVAGLAVGALIGALGTHLWGRRVGWLAAFLWLTTSEVFAYSREAGLEFWLVLFTGLGLYGFVRGMEERRWLYLAYLAMPLGMLVKGPMVILCVLVVVFLWLALTGRWSARGRLWHRRAFLLSLVVGLPWPVAMALRHDDFLWYTIVHEQIFRFLGMRRPNDALFPTSLFLLLVLGEFFPWVLHLPHALGAAFRRIRAGREPGLVLALVWSAFPLVFFSLARSKVDHYSLQIHPGWCLVVAWLWGEALEGRARTRWLALPWFVTAAVAVPCLIALRLREWDLPLPPLGIATTFLGIAAVGGAAIGIATAGRRLRLALAGIAVYMLGFFVIQHEVGKRRLDEESMFFAARAYAAEAPRGARLVSDERPEFGHVCVLPFYTGEPAWLVRDPEDSQLYFSFKDYEKQVIDEADLARWVRDEIPVYAVGDLERWPQRLRRLGLRGAVRARSGSRGLFRLAPGEASQTDP